MSPRTEVGGVVGKLKNDVLYGLFRKSLRFCAQNALKNFRLSFWVQGAILGALLPLGSGEALYWRITCDVYRRPHWQSVGVRAA